jgi:hypothetical protein
MSKFLHTATQKVQDFPASEQDRIASGRPPSVNDLEQLRADLRRGLKSLKAGQGREIHIEVMIARAHRGHGRINPASQIVEGRRTATAMFKSEEAQ